MFAHHKINLLPYLKLGEERFARPQNIERSIDPLIEVIFFRNDAWMNNLLGYETGRNINGRQLFYVSPLNDQ